MAATMQLTKVEGRLFLRDPIALFFGLVFPGLLLLGLELPDKLVGLAGQQLT